MRTGFIEIDECHAISIDENNNKSLISISNDDYSFNEIFTKEENLRKLKEKLKSKRLLVTDKENYFSYNQLLFKIIYTTLSIIVLLSSIGITISLVLSNLYIFSILYAIPEIISINSLINDIKDYIVINKDLKEFKLLKEDAQKLDELIKAYEKHIKDVYEQVEFKEEHNAELIENAIKKAHGINISNTDTLIYTKEESQKMAASQNATRKLLRTNPKRVDK